MPYSAREKAEEAVLMAHGGVRMRRWWTRVLALFGLVIVAGVLAIWLSQPPHRITIAAGPRDGGYYAFAKRYAAELAPHGVRLDILETHGAAENIDLVAAKSGRVQIALVQGGLAHGTTYPTVRSLGRFFYEPVWVFQRRSRAGDQLLALRGGRIAIGPAGSGTRALARKLLAANGIDERNSELLGLDTAAAIARIRSGELDAVVIVAALEAPIVENLLADPELHPLSFARAEAYAQQFPYLRHRTLPRGAVDFAADLPPSDVHLIVAAAAIVVRDDLHPSLVYLLAEIASGVHRRAARIEPRRELPESVDPEFEMAEAAARYHRHGMPLLHRAFSFWIADLIERLLLLAVPAIGIVLPLAKGGQMFYRYAVRRRIREYHAAVAAIDCLVSPELHADEIRAVAGSLENLEETIRAAPIPHEFVSDVQDVHDNIERVRARITRLGAISAPPAPPKRHAHERAAPPRC